VPGTGTLLDALTVLDKAIGANHGNGYGNYTIAVKDGDAVPPIFFVPFADDNPTSREFGYLSTDWLKQGTLKIVGIPGPDGALPTIQLNAQGRMFDMADNANVKMSINNVILRGLMGAHEEAYKIDPAAPSAINFVGTSGQDNNAPLIYVGQGNTFEMLGSAELTGNYNTGTQGGAAWVKDGTFLMTGDHTKIHHNYTAQYAGGVSCQPGKFIMSGEFAEVSENATATGDGTGVGGVYVEGGPFEMSGNHAKISKNQGGSNYSGGGIQLVGATGKMTGAYAEISENYSDFNGGGVYIGTSGRFTMSSGKISGNKATNDWGHNLFNMGSVGAHSYWAAGSTGYTGTHDTVGKIAATLDSSDDVDMWHAGGVPVAEYIYDLENYGVNLDMWADR
jgi:hypothetical protein